MRAAAARPSASAAGGIPFARVRTAAGGLIAARASALPRGGWGRGAPSPTLAPGGGAPTLNPARGGPRRSARSVRPLSCADVGGGAPSGLPCRPAPALGLFRAAPPVLPPRARRARVKGLRTPPLGLRAASALPRPHPPRGAAAALRRDKPPSGAASALLREYPPQPPPMDRAADALSRLAAAVRWPCASGVSGEWSLLVMTSVA